MGHETRISERVGEMEQTFWNPGAEPIRVRHRTTVDGDSMLTESFDGVGDRWEARRSYTWHRRPGHAAPC